jgi:hypothetical protein
MFIAAATVYLARDARLGPLVPPGAPLLCQRLLAAAPISWVGWLSRPGFGWLARIAELLTIPGLPLHFMLRKRWVLGAGFDTLSRDC